MRAHLMLALAAAVLGILSCSSSDGPDAPIVSAALTVAPSAGTAITDFSFDASGSTTDRGSLEYRWDWEADGVWDTDWVAEATAIHRFVSGVAIVTKLEVRAEGSVAGDSVEIDFDDRHGTIVERIALPAWANAKDIAFDGSCFWVTNWNLKTLKIDAATGDSLAVIPGPKENTGGIAWDGQYLWTADWLGAPKIFKQDPADGSVLASFVVVYTGGCGGLDWTGEVLYYGSDKHISLGDGRIHTYSRDGTHLSSFASPAGSLHPRGVAYDGRDLWVTIDESDTLYVVDADDGAVLRTVPYPERYVGGVFPGIVIVGDYVWALVGRSPADLVRVVP